MIEQVLRELYTRFFNALGDPIRGSRLAVGLCASFTLVFVGCWTMCDVHNYLYPEKWAGEPPTTTRTLLVIFLFSINLLSYLWGMFVI
jgi:hypothetical protein